MAEWAATFGATLTESENLCATFSDDESMGADFGEVQKVSTSDYNDLYNKPQIEGVTLQGNKTFPELGLGTITEQDVDNIIYGGI